MLVNNAANDQRHAYEDVTVEYWDERMATNLRHQFFAIQAVAPLMRAAGGGSIINFGSISWHAGQGGMPAYTTAKAGGRGADQRHGARPRRHGIRVNCVIPGWIMTQRQIDLWLTPEAEANLLRAQCLKTKLVPGGCGAAGAVAGRRRQPDVHRPVVGGGRRTALERLRADPNCSNVMALVRTTAASPCRDRWPDEPGHDVERPHSASAIQLPWNPSGTRAGRCTVAAGSPPRSPAFSTTRRCCRRADYTRTRSAIRHPRPRPVARHEYRLGRNVVGAVIVPDHRAGLHIVPVHGSDPAFRAPRRCCRHSDTSARSGDRHTGETPAGTGDDVRFTRVLPGCSVQRSKLLLNPSGPWRGDRTCAGRNHVDTVLPSSRS